ncbi:MAG: phosphoglycolate phosphatase [Pseudomonadota bacterium]|uniref:phosphoglycolate phosphatase n=1 Tax=Polaromonas sp. TaxID=1869339 RepID=UPI0017ADAAB0|nr:phosphoglycolate phosphatase [Polaromonas sp.]MBA3594625.1 phosphoglycolate phosphatase [Polaromonas sp.]MDQ3271007.1 phosphoglycolate phosphatase [Pseudomonadota bacterium]
MIEAAIVDLDGTMVDTLDDFVVALNLMLADLSLPLVDRRVVEPLVGKGSEHLILSVLDYVSKVPSAHARQAHSAINSGASDGVAHRFPAAWASYQRHYLAINGQHAAVYPGVLEGLRRLQDGGLALACLTNKPTAFALPLLKAKGLDGFFSQVFGGDAFERKKPDPLPLRKTCEALGTLPARTLMIGDSSNDAQAARAAGCPVLLVTYGYNHGEPVRAVDADGFVDTLADIDLASIKTGLAPR